MVIQYNLCLRFRKCKKKIFKINKLFYPSLLYLKIKISPMLIKTN